MFHLDGFFEFGKQLGDALEGAGEIEPLNNVEQGQKGALQPFKAQFEGRGGIR